MKAQQKTHHPRPQKPSVENSSAPSAPAPYQGRKPILQIAPFIASRSR